MSLSVTSDKSWRHIIPLFSRPEVITMLFLGFVAGLPLALIFSSLSLWLSEAGIDKSTVTYFSWAGLAYSFKFLWAPLIDRLPIPYLTAILGRRRAWLLIAQLLIMTAILIMAFTQPGSHSSSLYWMAFGALMLGFSSATQDIVIDAYRIESAAKEIQGLLSSTYIAGYRGGMLLSGAGALVLAQYFGSEKGNYQFHAWQLTYICMAATMLIGVATTLLIKEPEQYEVKRSSYSNNQYLRFLLLFAFCAMCFIVFYVTSAAYFSDLKVIVNQLLANAPLSNFLVESLKFVSATITVIVIGYGMDKLGLVERQLVRENYLLPINDFFSRYGIKLALLLLLFIGFYRVSDIVLGVIANVFYQDMGFSKTEIASVAKTFGLIMMLLGGFIGGVLSIRFGVLKMLFVGAVLTVLTNLLFMVLASAGHDMLLLYLVISADNLTAGLASAAFIAFLSSITSISFTAVQYAIFSSLMTLLPKIIGGYSGSMVENLGYSNFFLFASLIGVPVIFLIPLLGQLMKRNESSSTVTAPVK